MTHRESMYFFQYLPYDSFSVEPTIWVRWGHESERGQMVLKKVKLTYFNFNDNIKNVAFLIFFGLPTPSEVSLSRIVSPKKAVFRAFFLENHVFDPFRPNEDPQVLYMAGKLWISSFWWYKGKIFFLHPAERAIFYDGPDRYFPLYWEAVPLKSHRVQWFKYKKKPL